MSKVVIGMSGGVDSSVAAYLLDQQGYEVEGISFIMWESGADTVPTACCSYQGIEEASGTARHLGIPHRVIDVREEFTSKVIEPFVQLYTAGLTPNPCVLCNRHIKFPFLMKIASESKARFISTGHYARVEPAERREQKAKTKPGTEHMHEYFLLKKGIDPRKDQSYVLYGLTQNELKRLILPLGAYRKEHIRTIAEELHLPARKSESQEICFIENSTYCNFIEKLSPVAKKPGSILDLNGRVIGKHRGLYGYTIGQRKGMGISSPEPLYVVHIDAAHNTIYAGPRSAAEKRGFYVGDMNWISPAVGNIPVISNEDKEGFRASVKVRSTMKDQPATIFIMTKPTPPYFPQPGEGRSPDVVQVVFDEPQWAPAPGQSAVFYYNDNVIGGGIILE
jgi:tRNA-specific 2-thiouridylase